MINIIKRSWRSYDSFDRHSFDCFKSGGDRIKVCEYCQTCHYNTCYCGSECWRSIQTEEQKEQYNKNCISKGWHLCNKHNLVYRDNCIRCYNETLEDPKVKYENLGKNK